MIIKEIVIEGFKSYSARTVIQGFDIHFNAITGLNGSGKSNILDAICFVLGISTLSVVRVNNLHELIYKNGQAGVTRANVTILFDNSDKNRSIEPYRTCEDISVRREIQVGGGSKYTINGTKATAERVKNLFMMSGLNVNNANFLIMQGMITKVTKMRPREIMSMIEETAGTSTYDSKRAKAIRHMQNKDKKFTEIQRILTEELAEKMDKLKKEREKYNEYKSLKEEAEQLEKKIVAYNYDCYLHLIQEADIIISRDEMKLQGFQDQILELLKVGEDLQRQKQVLTEEIQSNQFQDEKEEYDTMRVRLNGLEKQLSLIQSNIQQSYQNLKQYQNNLKRLKDKSIEIEADISFQQRNEQSAAQILQEVEERLDSLESRKIQIEQGQDVYQNDQELIKKKENEFQKLQQMLNGYRSKIQMISQQRQKKERDLNSIQDCLQDTTHVIENLQKEIQNLEQQLRSQEDDDKSFQISNLESQSQQLQRELNQLQLELQRSNADKYTLKYNNPEQNFDRSKVIDRVIRLITVKNKRYNKALEAAVGGNLFCIVIENEQVGQVLLKRKTFGNCKLLPNNQMRPREIPHQIKENARKRFGNQAIPAIDLIEYDSRWQNAIKFVFGHFFVCENNQIASSIAYDNGFKRLAVTLDGDIYDPSGSISGGHSAQQESHLDFLSKIKDNEIKFNKVKRQKNDLDKELDTLKQQNEAVATAKDNLNRKRQQLKNKEESIAISSIDELKIAINRLAQEEKGFVNSVEQGQDQLQRLQEQINELQNEGQSQSDPLESIKRKIQKAKKEKNQKSTELNKARQNYSNRVEEHKSLLVQIQDEEMKSQEESKAIRETENELKNKQQQFNDQKELTDKLKEDLDGKIKLDKKRDKELRALNNQIDQNTKSIKKTEREQEVLKSGLEKTKKQAQEADKEVKALRKSHRWVLDQEELERFKGQVDRNSLEETEQKHQILQERIDFIGKRVNKKVNSTLQDHEEQFQDLQLKRDLLIRDKEQLSEIISDIDSKKTVRIEETRQLVDQNLRDIFTTLLPGATASLVDESSGLELKVAFNGIWKKNLSELSGGQRSLLALSLILALLKVNPAPIYILDEIDAALDISHTQNIGNLVQRHFAQSQFIVVSLKEEMFNNANVLFRTQFINGKSTVERQALRYNSADNEANEKINQRRYK